MEIDENMVVENLILMNFAPFIKKKDQKIYDKESVDDELRENPGNYFWWWKFSDNHSFYMDYCAG